MHSSTRFTATAVLAAATLSANCDYAADNANYIRERLTPDISASELRELQVRAKNATSSCHLSGDLWYLRSLINSKLGVKDAGVEKRAAELRAKMTIRQDYDPFRTTTEAPVPETLRQKWALVIGIGKFRDTTIPALRFTSKDAKDFATALQDPKVGKFAAGHVKAVIDEAATVSGIREGIGWLRSNAQPGDLVVIYISSHGSPRSLDKFGMSYIVTHETTVADSAKLYASSYQMVDLVQDLTRDIPARRQVLILDTCHSGGAIPGAKSLVAEGVADTDMTSFSGAFRAMKMGTGRVILTASRVEERSWEDERLDGGRGNGYFTYHLLSALRESKGEKAFAELFPSVQKAVAAAVLKDSPAGSPRTQTPMMYATERGGEIKIGAPVQP